MSECLHLSLLFEKETIFIIFVFFCVVCLYGILSLDPYANIPFSMTFFLHLLYISLSLWLPCLPIFHNLMARVRTKTKKKKEKKTGMKIASYWMRAFNHFYSPTATHTHTFGIQRKKRVQSETLSTYTSFFAYFGAISF